MPSRPRSKSGLIGTIFRRFQTENMAQTSAALAFTTLLALVPLVAVVISLASAVPYFDTLISRLESMVIENLLPTGSAGAISGQIGKFALKAQELTVPGIAMLAFTALVLMHTIERTFNHLWQVKPRPLLARIKLYAFVMAVWPFILGGVAAIMSYAVTTSLGLIDEQLWLQPYLLKISSILMLGLFFAFLYYAVPNAKVSRPSAALGGLFAAVTFAGMQKVFELYLSAFGALKSVYGAFSVAPIFLIWLHFSWAVVLIGGLLAATVSRRTRH